jgi:propionyl-CoA synthetase
MASSPGVFWAASIGWVRPPYISMPCQFGCTTVLFEGKPVGTPDAGVRAPSRTTTSCVSSRRQPRSATGRGSKGELIKKHDLSHFALFLPASA